MPVTETADPGIAKQDVSKPAPPPRPAGHPNAQPVPVRFAFLAAQLALLLFVIIGLKLTSGAQRSLPFALCVYGMLAFVVHYWLPFHLKKTGFVLLSLGAAFAALGPSDWLAFTSAEFWQDLGGAAKFVLTAVAVGAVFFGSLRLPAPFLLRLVLVLGVAGGLAYARAHHLWLSNNQWAILGAIFMFRMILYAKEVQVARKPEKFSDFMCYFFLLPNMFFSLFPVIDYATFKRGHYAKNIHDSAQKGIFWMTRGVIQLCVFRILYQRELSNDSVSGIGTLIVYLFQFYLQYLRVSGFFHFIIGMVQLFGWELPETNRKYLFASSFTDFWRRINIYWKDFMVKAFYYPAYFRLRKINDRLALTVATIVVFIATTVLHGYQLFWITGTFRIAAKDYLFWGALGVIVLLTVLYEAKRGRPKKRSKLAAFGLRIASTIGVYVTISLLWSLWSLGPEAWWEVVSFVLIP